MKTELTVTTSSATYSILFDKGFFSENRDELCRLIKDKQIAIITDENVAKEYLEKISEILLELKVIKIVFPAGEQSKSLYNFEQIITILAKENFRKNAVMLALGGGMVGDLSGFSAACYQRGIDYIQIPTSLLAQVDASIGGKTAINHDLAKNLIGAFYQPKAVFVNIGTLTTLPEREYKAGLAEVIKYGLIADKKFLQWLIDNCDKILQRDTDSLMQVVKRCCEIKRDIVAQDERDHGIRQILNFGHTFAHAIETGLNYQYLHGEAVAMGIAQASYLSWQQGNIAKQEFDYICSMLKQFDLPTVWPSALSKDAAIEIMQRDKKNISDNITFVLLKAIGQAYITNEINNVPLYRG